MNKVSNYRSSADISASLLLLLSEEESLTLRISFAEENLTEKLQRLYDSEGKDEEIEEVFNGLSHDFESANQLLELIADYRFRLQRFEKRLKASANVDAAQDDSILSDSARSALVSVGTLLMQCDKLESECNELCTSESEFLTIAIEEIGETWSEMREGSVEEVKVLANELSSTTFVFSKKEEAQSVTYELQRERSQVDLIASQSKTLFTLLKKILEVSSELLENFPDDVRQQAERLMKDTEEQSSELEQHSDQMQGVIISIREEWNIL